MDTTFKLQEEWHKIPYQVAILEHKMQTMFPVKISPTRGLKQQHISSAKCEERWNAKYNWGKQNLGTVKTPYKLRPLPTSEKSANLWFHRYVLLRAEAACLVSKAVMIVLLVIKKENRGSKTHKMACGSQGWEASSSLPHAPCITAWPSSIAHRSPCPSITRHIRASCKCSMSWIVLIRNLIENKPKKT